MQIKRRRKLTGKGNIHLHLLALLIVLKSYITPKTKLRILNQLQSYLLNQIQMTSYS